MSILRTRMTLISVAAIVVIVLIGAAVGACGLGPLQGQGTLTGDVVAGPTCPVERVDNPCPPKPVPNREIQVLDTTGTIVASTKTDASGHFSLVLAPGDYQVNVPYTPGQIGISQVTKGNVRVVANQSVYIKIELDTGIR